MKCIICGKEIERSMYSHKPLCSSECFDEDFWNTVLNDEAIIIDGVCYHDGGCNETVHSSLLGFGGKEFIIKRNDGTIIRTNNLWHNGTVPANRNVEDNAVFIK